MGYIYNMKIIILYHRYIVDLKMIEPTPYFEGHCYLM